MNTAKRFSSRQTSLAIIYFALVVFCIFTVYYLIKYHQNHALNPSAVSQKLPHLTPQNIAAKSVEPIVQAPESEQNLQKQSAESRDYDGPLQELVPTEAQSRALYEAEEVLVKRCMNERGFEYIPYSYTDQSDLDSQIEPVKPGDITAAQSRGYGIADDIALRSEMQSSSTNDGVPNTEADTLPLGAMDPNDIYIESLSSEQKRAWNEAFMGKVNLDASVNDSVVGVEDPSFGSIIWDTNSCLAFAQRAIYTNDFEQVENRIAEHVLREKIREEADQDAVYQSSLEKWRQCMAERNLPYAYPEQAIEQLSARYAEGKLDIETLKVREIEIASADAACYRQHGFAEARATAKQRAEAKLR